jgi:hypothetical protein
MILYHKIQIWLVFSIIILLLIKFLIVFQFLFSHFINVIHLLVFSYLVVLWPPTHIIFNDPWFKLLSSLVLEMILLVFFILKLLKVFFILAHLKVFFILTLLKVFFILKLLKVFSILLLKVFLFKLSFINFKTFPLLT